MDTSKIAVWDDPVYKKYVVGQVRYNECLDFWDGVCWSTGSQGSHLGITKRMDGHYVLIHKYEYSSGAVDYSANTVSNREALNAILETGHEELLERKKFQRLKELKDNVVMKEGSE